MFYADGATWVMTTNNREFAWDMVKKCMRGNRIEVKKDGVVVWSHPKQLELGL